MLKPSATLKGKAYTTDQGIRYEVRDEEVYYGVPVESKDQDEAMSPMEGLLATLAGCKVGWVLGHAESNGIDIQGVEVSCQGEFGELDEGQAIEADLHTGFKEIRSNYKIKSDSDPARIQDYIYTIDQICIVGNSLKNPPSLTHSLEIV